MAKDVGTVSGTGGFCHPISGLWLQSKQVLEPGEPVRGNGDDGDEEDDFQRAGPG
jgi:hypothetical protein